MDQLMINGVLRIEGDDLDGFYRIVAMPSGANEFWIAYMGPWRDVADDVSAQAATAVGAITSLSIPTYLEMEGRLLVKVVNIQPKRALLRLPEDFNDSEREKWTRRTTVAGPFLNHEKLCETLALTGGIGPLVREAVRVGGCGRATAYRVWKLLCKNGFDTSSLNLLYEDCGAPGVQRPVGPGRQKAGAKSAAELLGSTNYCPQAGVTEADRVKFLHHFKKIKSPLLTDRQVYDEIVERAYVTQYVQVGNNRVAVMPPQGSFPNYRQYRHIVDTGIKRLERVMRRTTPGHYARNMRGLVGRAYDNVAGPGHAYAIDSTVGDVHLRSAINRAWPTGRPVVYVVVDIWSTAVVGFYVCLNGPSWATAKLALFSTFADPAFMAQLWGYEHIDVLSPPPAVPYTVISDRGEYLSLGARETCGQLGINFAINPAYRPDLKGLVEVLHRIAKDQQIQFLPGAIDARRKELELRTDARESVLTLREYVQFLHTTFAHYNLFADRSHRMTAEMIAAGVDPSPAGLWRFGHEVAVGYQKHLPQDRLITGLLQRRQAVSRRDGIFFESSEYKGEIAQTQEWSAVARNFGSIDKTAYHFPGSMGQFWWPDPHGGLHEFKLTENARVTPEVSLEEWRDALMYETTKNGGRQYRRLTGAINSMEKHRALTQRAIELTGQADAAYVGVKPNVRETRMFDSLDVAFEPSNPGKTDKPSVADENANYEALMDEVFASLNREGSL